MAERWCRLFRGRAVIQAGKAFDERKYARIRKDPEKVKECRERLKDLSWFMRCLSESLARSWVSFISVFYCLGDRFAVPIVEKDNLAILVPFQLQGVLHGDASGSDPHDQGCGVLSCVDHPIRVGDFHLLYSGEEILIDRTDTRAVAFFLCLPWVLWVATRSVNHMIKLLGK